MKIERIQLPTFYRPFSHTHGIEKETLIYSAEAVQFDPNSHNQKEKKKDQPQEDTFPSPEEERIPKSGEPGHIDVVA